MKISQRIKNYANNSIICKIQIEKPNKTECRFFIESLNKDGDILSTAVEKMSYAEIKKLVDIFSTKMKKCASLVTTPVYSNFEQELLLFINPDLMEKERVGFELYGAISDKNANANIVAYYSFADSENDFRQPVIHDNLFGFFSMTNFESPNGSLKATLNEIGVTYTLLEGTTNNFLFLSLAEFERQYQKEEIKETKKRIRKAESTIPQEIKELKKSLAQQAQADTEKEIPIEEPPKRGRGRPMKSKDEVKTTDVPVSTESPKRGRGRPPKNKLS